MVLATDAPESIFVLSTLLGFALQGFVPIARRKPGFPDLFRPYALLPNPLAWQRRFDDFRSPNQLNPPALELCFKPEWGRGPPELWHLSGFSRQDL
jgi:hypothetical protein